MASDDYDTIRVFPNHFPVNPKRVAAGKKSKRKGNNSERAVSKLLQQWWGHGEFARTPSSGGWATAAVREAFRTCGDIITTALDWPFCVENKSQEGWTLDQLLHNDKCIIHKWWEQASSESPTDMCPLLIAGRNRVPRIVIFSSERMKFIKDIDLTVFIDLNPYASFECGNGLTYEIMPIKNFLAINPNKFGRYLPNTGK